MFLLIGARAVEDLLGDSTNHLTSFDFQNGKALAGSAVPSFRGVNIVRTQRIPDETAATTFRGLLMSQDAVKVAMAQDLDIRIDERVDLAHVMQVTAYMMFGAVRMEEDKVVDILYQ